MRRNTVPAETKMAVIELRQQGIGSGVIAERLGVSATFVMKTVREWGMGRLIERPDGWEADAEARYRAGESVEAIGKVYRAHSSHISSILRARGLDVRKRAFRTGVGHKDGYRYRYVEPNHPFWEMAHKKKGAYGAYILEHRLVMAEMLGRPLARGENVHHKNGIRDDNRPENLELWTIHQPAGQRAIEVKHCPTCTCGG